MAQWGMNCYLYAPKDDDKHRAIWRDLYSLEEAGGLIVTCLIYMYIVCDSTTLLSTFVHCCLCVMY